MGTNYYATSEPCAHCGRSAERLHVGKSGFGWRFLFHGHPELGLTTWAQWRARLAEPGTLILDEYGKPITLADLEEKIAAKQSGQLDADGYVDPEGHPFIMRDFS